MLIDTGYLVVPITELRHSSFIRITEFETYEFFLDFTPTILYISLLANNKCPLLDVVLRSGGAHELLVDCGHYGITLLAEVVAGSGHHCELPVVGYVEGCTLPNNLHT